MKKLPIDKCFREIPEKPDFVLPGMLHGTVGSIVSPGASGKSFLALQLGIQISSGVDVLGWGQTLPTGDVVYLAGEDPSVALHQRIYELGRLLKPVEKDQIAEGLSIYPLAGAPDSPDLLAPDSEHGLIELLRGKRLLIIDTLRRFHSGNENDSGEMSRLVSAMEKIAHETGCSVVFLHHSSKSAAMNGTVGEQQASRGSSVLTDNVRWQAYLSKMSPSETKEKGVKEKSRGLFVRFGISKHNYCAPFEDVWLERGQGGVLRYRDLTEAKRNSERRTREGH